MRPFVVNYFLADDTIEVLEVHDANSGRDAFPSCAPETYLTIARACAATARRRRRPHPPHHLASSPT